MPTFNKTLNANEIYLGWTNMIIGIRLFDISSAEPTLANMVRTDGTLFGDTKLYRSQDVLGSYPWGNDAEAPNLLLLNRNKTQYEQAITINIFRQCFVTVDQYLSKRAWMSEGSFADFNSQLISSLNDTKRIYDNGLINTFVGTQKSTASAANFTLASPTGQTVAQTLADLSVQMADNNRYLNELTYNRAFPFSQCIVVYNSNYYNKILKIDLPVIFHRDGLTPKAEYVMAPRYFGNVNSSDTVGNTDTITDIKGRILPGEGTSGAVRSLIEQDITYNSVTVHYFPGDAIATGATAPAGTSYTQSDSYILKVFPTDAIPFMSAFEVHTMFVNGRSLTDNHYLTWGHNALERIKERPFITLESA